MSSGGASSFWTCTLLFRIAVMSAENFYVKPGDVSTEHLSFPPEEAAHIRRVLRKKKGDIVHAVDGTGNVFEAELLTVSAETVEARILSKRRRVGEPSATVTLAQAVIKGDRFDWVVEKAAELGVARLIPVTSRYTQLGGNAKKTARWQRIALAAMKQCGRSILPEITETKNFSRTVSLGADFDLRLIAHAGPGSRPVPELIPDNYRGVPRIFLLVGPEGGFSPEEIEEARGQGFWPVSLGPRRLRSETAAVTLTVQVMTCLQELS